MKYKTWQEMAADISKLAERKAAEDLIDVQVKVMAASYDKMMAYTNLIIVAGYASFFGLWQITKEQLNEKQILYSALLMTISATIFVTFEVTKTFFHSKSAHGLNKINSQEQNRVSIKNLQQALAQHQEKVQKQTVYWGYWWYFAWFGTVLTGLGAVGILMWSFATTLIKQALIN